MFTFVKKVKLLQICNVLQNIAFYPLQQRKPAFLLDSILAIELKLRVVQYVSTKNNDNGRCEMVSAKADFLLASYEARKSLNSSQRSNFERSVLKSAT